MITYDLLDISDLVIFHDLWLRKDLSTPTTAAYSLKPPISELGPFVFIRPKTFEGSIRRQALSPDVLALARRLPLLQTFQDEYWEFLATYKFSGHITWFHKTGTEIKEGQPIFLFEGTFGELMLFWRPLLELLSFASRATRYVICTKNENPFVTFKFIGARRRRDSATAKTYCEALEDAGFSFSNAFTSTVPVFAVLISLPKLRLSKSTISELLDRHPIPKRDDVQFSLILEWTRG